MADALEILRHIEELYGTPNTVKSIGTLQQDQPALYEAWQDAFREYDLADVLTAIDSYWEYKSDKTRPTVAKIKASLNAHKTEKLAETSAEVPQAKVLDLAWSEMNRDIDAGSCRYNLYLYRDAERIILDEYLPKEIPGSVWAKMSYESKVKNAVSKGLTAYFPQALAEACRRKLGRECEYQSKSDLAETGAKYGASGTVKTVAAHWSA